MAEPSGMTELPARVPEPGESYLSRWNAQAQQFCWPLRGQVVSLGRASCADVVLDGDPCVSRVHATLERVAGGWTIDDSGLSRNGTFVNGRRLSGRLQLHDRDEIRLGTTVLTFCAPAEAASVHTLIGEPLPTTANLTAAQRAVLTALCRPYKVERSYAVPPTNQQIADELFLSVDAVKTHLRALFHRFGIEQLPQNQKRARLVEMALQYGLVSPHDL